MYQQEDGSWDPIELGPESFPGEPLWDKPWPAGGDDSATQKNVDADGESGQ
jgi:hypothetical protein